jgi:hypothetical protein
MATHSSEASPGVWEQEYLDIDALQEAYDHMYSIHQS